MAKKAAMKAKKKRVTRKRSTSTTPTKKQFSTHTEHVSDFLGFIEFVKYRLRMDFSFIDTIFRGQADAKWHPVAKIDRPDFERWRTGIGGKRLEHEQALLRDFKKLARPHLTCWPRDEWEWLAIAQHHGLCTRLLDWTRNALVALYFAVEDIESRRDCAVWCYFHGGQASECASDPFQLKSVVLCEPPHITSRITTQASCFTAHPRGGEPNEKTWRGSLVKIIIPSNEKKSIKEFINDLGINRASLFPDLDGVASHTNRMFSKLECEEYI